MENVNINDPKGLEVFETFKKDVLKVKEKKHNTVERAYIYGIIKVLWMAAIMVFFTNLFWIINAVLKNNESGILNATPLIILIIFNIFSIIIVWLHFMKDKMPVLLIRIAILIYYVIICASVCILIINRNINILENDLTVDHSGIALSTFYLLIPAFLPLYKKEDRIILDLSYVIAIILPLFFSSNEIYPIISYILIIIFLLPAKTVLSRLIYERIEKSYAVSSLNDALLISAYKDELTSTLNRRALNTYWDYLCNKEDTYMVGVILFDIDDFKKYNDTYTHGSGDEVLKEICKLVINEIGKDNLFLFRFGGEEFIILLNNPNEEDIVKVGLKINSCVWDANIKRDDGATYDRLSVTLGLTKMYKKEMLETNYITKVDKELYVGKNNNKNCVVYEGRIFRTR